MEKKSIIVLLIILIGIVLALLLSYLAYTYFKNPIEKTHLNETENAQTPAIGLNQTPDSTSKNNETNSTTTKKTTSGSSSGGGGGGGGSTSSPQASCTPNCDGKECGDGCGGICLNCCGNDLCEANETCSTCPIDCGACPLGNGTAYYFSSSKGNDSNDGKSPLTPWKNLDKIYIKSSSKNKFQPGDLILLKAGDTWEGNILLTSSGTKDARITIGRYGVGPNPIIYGDYESAAWTLVPGYLGVYSTYLGEEVIINTVVEGTNKYAHKGICWWLTNITKLDSCLNSLIPGSFTNANLNTLYVKTLNGESPENMKSFVYAAVSLFDAGASYVTIENLDVRRSHVGIDISSSDNIIVKNNSIQDTLNIAISLRPGDGIGNTNVLVENNTVSRAGNTALYIHKGSNNTMRGNTVYNVTRRILGIDVGGTDACGLGLQQSANNLIEYNSFYYITSGIFDYEYETNTIARYNYGFHAPGGFFPHGTGLKFYGNIFNMDGVGRGGYASHAYSPNFSAMPDAGPILVYNNLVYNTITYGVGGIDNMNLTTSQIFFRNNLIVGDSKGLMNPGKGVDSDYNCFYRINPLNVTGFGGYANLSSYQNATGQDLHSIFADPIFVDAENGDFHLQKGSVAIDAGIDVGLPYFGSAPDIGAYEFILNTNEKCNYDLDCQSRGQGFFCNSSSGCEYEPPIGIPAPLWGIYTTHWMYAGKTYDYIYEGGNAPYKIGPDGPYTHYVDALHPNSTDINNPYGTFNKPRKTLPIVRNLPAGSVVELHGVLLSNDNLNGSGTLEKPIFIRGVKTQEATLGVPWIILGNYYIFENLILDIQQYSRHAFLLGLEDTNQTHFSFRNLEIKNMTYVPTQSKQAFIISKNHNSSSIIENVVIYNCNFHNLGEGRTGGKYDSIGISVRVNAKNIWILDNNFSFIGGDGIQIDSDYMDSKEMLPSYVYIGRNTFNDNFENAVDLKTCRHIILSENIAYNFGPAYSAISRGSPFRYGGQDISTNNISKEYIWTIFNRVYNVDAPDGAFLSYSVENRTEPYADNIYYIGNVVHDLHNPNNSSTGFVWWNQQRIYLIGNTVSNADRAASVVSQGTYPLGVQQMTIVNNIFANSDNHPSFYSIIFSGTNSSLGNMVMKKNLFYNGQRNVTVRRGVYPGGGTLGVSWMDISFDKWKELFPFEAVTSFVSNPRFADSLNFDLSQNSLAIDSGEADIIENISNLYYSFYGIDIRKDIEGRARPQGSGWDIGAYEYPSGIGGASYSVEESNNLVESTEEDLHSENAIGTILNWFRGLLTGNTIKAITGYFLKIE